MAELKCKMCGGNIIVQSGATYGICDSCGNECDLEITQSERNQLLQKEVTIKNQINDLHNKQIEIQRELDEINELPKRKKKTIIATFLSAILLFALPFANVSENISGAIGTIGLVTIFIAFPMLKKYAGVYANKKGGMVLGLFLQYITLGIFGLVAGCKKIFKFNSTEKKYESLRFELSEKLQELKSEENRLQKIIVIVNNGE